MPGLFSCLGRSSKAKVVRTSETKVFRTRMNSQNPSGHPRGFSSSSTSLPPSAPTIHPPYSPTHTPKKASKSKKTSTDIFHDTKAIQHGKQADACINNGIGKKVGHWIWSVFPGPSLEGITQNHQQYLLTYDKVANILSTQPDAFETYLTRATAFTHKDADLGSNIDEKKLITSLCVFAAVARDIKRAYYERIYQLLKTNCSKKKSYMVDTAQQTFISIHLIDWKHFCNNNEQRKGNVSNLLTEVAFSINT